MTCELYSRQSRFSRQSRPSRLSQASAMTLTAYLRCVIPTASPTDKTFRHNSLVTQIAL